MDAQGRGQDSWFKAGKPWDPHWIQAGTERRLRGLPSSCPASDGVPAVGCWMWPLEPARLAVWGSRAPSPALPGEYLAREPLARGGLDAPQATLRLIGVKPTD